MVTGKHRAARTVNWPAPPATLLADANGKAVTKKKLAAPHGLFSGSHRGMVTLNAGASETPCSGQMMNIIHRNHITLSDLCHQPIYSYLPSIHHMLFALANQQAESEIPLAVPLKINGITLFVQSMHLGVWGQTLHSANLKILDFINTTQHLQRKHRTA